MAKLGLTAQRVYDLYEQNYAPNDRFLDIDDFKFHIAAIYTTMLDAQFQTERKAGKAETGFANVEITAQWMIEEVLNIECNEDEDKYFTKTSQPILGFRFDASANSLQGIHSFGNPHIIYRKISLQERRFKQNLPVVGDRSFFYVNSEKEIIFWFAKAGSKIKVQYIPAALGLDDDCLLADSISNEIIATLELMFKAKNGNFIQKLDDQNPNNATPQANPVTTK